MAGLTWLTHPEWGVGALYLAPAWSRTCTLQEKLGAAGCTMPAALLHFTTAAVSQHTHRPDWSWTAPGWLCAKLRACTFGAGLATHFCCSPSTAAPLLSMYVRQGTRSLHNCCELSR